MSRVVTIAQSVISAPIKAVPKRRIGWRSSRKTIQSLSSLGLIKTMSMYRLAPFHGVFFNLEGKGCDPKFENQFNFPKARSR
ncbi:hypothetical protein NBRC116493_15590 [Aurantivibrio infirmus]